MKTAIAGADAPVAQIAEVQALETSSSCAVRPVSEDELWLLSFYRTSEISGALFFGRLARSLRPSPVQVDLTQHFADEANHAAYWTACIDRLGLEPLKLRESYQDRYLEAAGLPTNMMEVLSITQVFEKRVIGQYSRHLRSPGVRPEVRETLDRIMDDERWHIKWVGEALRNMETTYGADRVRQTIARHTAADEEVYAEALEEYGERLEILRSSAA